MRNRNIGVRRVPVSLLLDNPRNHRNHPEDQAEALTDMVNQIGWTSLPVVYPVKRGKYRLVDGHLRKAWYIEHYGEEADILVMVVDFDEREGDLALALHDTLTAAGVVDGERLKGLLDDVDIQSEALMKFLGQDLPMVGADVTADADFEEGEYDEGSVEADEEEVVEVGFRCPRCAHAWTKTLRGKSPSPGADVADG